MACDAFAFRLTLALHFAGHRAKLLGLLRQAEPLAAHLAKQATHMLPQDLPCGQHGGSVGALAGQQLHSPHLLEQVMQSEAQLAIKHEELVSAGE